MFSALLCLFAVVVLLAWFDSIRISKPDAMSAGGPEDALVEAFKEGIRDIPQPYDEAVINRAIDLVGQNFFDSLDSIDEPDDFGPDGPGEDWASNELENEAVPFSARRDELVAAIVRYWMKDEASESKSNDLLAYGAFLAAT